MIKLLKNQNNNKNLTTFLNPYSYLLARKNKELFKNFNIKIDGILLVKFLKFAGIDYKRKSFDMTSLAPVVFEKAIKENKTIYFVGTTDSNLKSAINNIKKEFNNINIIGYKNGYFKDNEKNIFIDDLVKLSPDIVICGMGTILQEEFLLNLKERGWSGVGYTCGGFLHQTAKDIIYYPKWIDKYNLRWAYRFYKEPNTRKRILLDYPKFIIIFMYDYLIYLRQII